MTSPFTLGQRVKFAAQLRRAQVYEPGQWGGRRKKVWSRTDYFGEPMPGGEGIVVGIRNLADGYAEFEDGVGYVFDPTERHVAVLIATDLRRRLVFAFLEDVEALP